MRVIDTLLKDAYIIEVKKFEDERGFFMEAFNQKDFNHYTRTDYSFVQDNHSQSSKNVLRGLHYQIENSQGKLVKCINGAVYDVIVDLRQSSPTYRMWFGIELNRKNLMLWVPPGFAHGFYTLTDKAEFMYKTTDYWSKEYERTLMWDDPVLNIDWKLKGDPILSPKDLQGQYLEDCDKFQ
jgi:dTDP-4-dehydrorhamnose 3,5-epimerase